MMLIKRTGLRSLKFTMKKPSNCRLEFFGHRISNGESEKDEIIIFIF